MTGSDATIGTADVMRRALSLATHGPAFGVNPQVGCVILGATFDGSLGRIISEGWHRGAGTPHAEVDALSKLTPAQTRGATAVVTLEPCNHTGRTGPCSEALLAAGITRVIYAVSDPGPHSGGGALRLQEAGIVVEGGVLEGEASILLRVWLTATRLGRPYVTVKWASSLDGRAAANDGTSQWITGAAARQRVHEQRAVADAILVGTGTVLADDPSLTARGDAGELMPHQPMPVVIGEREISATARVRSHPQPVVILKSRDLKVALEALFAQDVRHVFVEGGPTLASAFIAAGLTDELLIYLAPVLLGGSKLALGELGVPTISAARTLTIDSIEQLGADYLITARPSELHNLAK